jgi:hypothetical protein
MAILTLLAGILFTVFAGAKEKARQTHCMNNLKQLGAAILLYRQDYDGGWPPSSFILYPDYVSDKQLYACPDDGMPASKRKGYESVWQVYCSYDDNLPIISGDFLRRQLAAPGLGCKALAEAMLRHRYADKLCLMGCANHMLPGSNRMDQGYGQRVIDAKVHAPIIYLWQDGHVSSVLVSDFPSIGTTVGVSWREWNRMVDELADQLARQQGSGQDTEE